VTVYVDDMRAMYRRMIMCHMIADSDDELHAMADTIGVARRWWQSPQKTSGSHYDICLTKRQLSLAAGAVPITLRQLATMNWRRRVEGKLGAPEEAEAWIKAWRSRLLNAAPLPNVRVSGAKLLS
jgi:hypothetical protein